MKRGYSGNKKKKVEAGRASQEKKQHVWRPCDQNEFGYLKEYGEFSAIVDRWDWRGMQSPVECWV